MRESRWDSPAFHSWRERARQLLQAGIPPGEVEWDNRRFESEREHRVRETVGSADRVAESNVPYGNRVSKSFFPLARVVACHADPRKWELLYRILWRMTQHGEKHLLLVATDVDVRKAMEWAREVRRELFEMRTAVRFSLCGVSEQGRQQLCGWHEPEHLVVRWNSHFFRKKWAEKDWTLFSPAESVRWDGTRLQFGPGVGDRSPCDEATLLELWREYPWPSTIPSRQRAGFSY